jgi:hypothetical protein
LVQGVLVVFQKHHQITMEIVAQVVGKQVLVVIFLLLAVAVVAVNFRVLVVELLRGVYQALHILEAQLLLTTLEVAGPHPQLLMGLMRNLAGLAALKVVQEIQVVMVAVLVMEALAVAVVAERV